MPQKEIGESNNRQESNYIEGCYSGLHLVSSHLTEN